MAVISRRIGTATVTALSDGEGLFFQPRTQAFPDADERAWALADGFDPGAAAPEGQWRLRFRTFAIRLDDGRTILFDAGIGPADSPAASWAPVPGSLPESLAEAGIDPGDISQIIISHLHTDHIGWWFGGLFPQAEVLLQRTELEWITPRLDGLMPKERLVLLDGDSKLAGPVQVVATPGHTPGHQSCLVTEGDEVLALTGDLLVHAIQLVLPEMRYALEMDPDRARESRVSLLAQAKTLGTSHLTEAFTDLR
ncbi:MBL fold metallo-hydrolase [Rhizocola hellebori]|uniref:MBL fold metallo-hydrolase n=1 Tax=Rhizocola hellebori TaxID=1392758 RepID=A0A8J3Q7B7_9ACTN|nr:MBL fold metallo-hydrolase [Rhizocola hellebori]GIH04430.1 MBL fold metallo-hydrolase [Rhizocola hellebori]